MHYSKIKRDHCAPTREDALELWNEHGRRLVGLTAVQVHTYFEGKQPWSVCRFLRHVTNEMGLTTVPDGWPGSHLTGQIRQGRVYVSPVPEQAPVTPVRLNPAPGPDGLTIEELLADRKKRFNRKKATKLAECQVSLPVQGPFGVLLEGDPHVDDDGTDWHLLDRHIHLVRTIPTLYALCVGDLQNNWVGRLAALYAHQSTTSKESWRLAEYFVMAQRDKWVGIVGGNHDHWTGDGDPMTWIMNQAGVPADGKHELKLSLSTMDDGEPIRIWARHDFPGRSQWNKTHGQGKAAMMRSYRADVLVSGHRHTWGTRSEPRDDGSVWHALQIGAYKHMDSYAEKLGFPDTIGGSAALIVCDPRKTGAARVQVFMDVEVGARALQLMRADFEANG